MRSRIILPFLLICLFNALGYAQGDASFPPDAKAGECYALCLVEYDPDDIQKIEEITYPVYIGSDPKVKTKEVTITLQLPKSGWVKKKDFNCVAVDQNDCMKWTLEEERPGIYKKLKVIKNPKKTTPSDIQQVSYKVVVNTDEIVTSQTEWRQVACSNHITSEFMIALYSALREKGYALSATPASNTMGEDAKIALHDYQKKNKLPIGSLDVETLNSLGISF